jgi:hypothetical protein
MLKHPLLGFSPRRWLWCNCGAEGHALEALPRWFLTALLGPWGIQIMVGSLVVFCLYCWFDRGFCIGLSVVLKEALYMFRWMFISFIIHFDRGYLFCFLMLVWNLVTKVYMGVIY